MGNSPSTQTDPQRTFSQTSCEPAHVPNEDQHILNGGIQSLGAPTGLVIEPADLSQLKGHTLIGQHTFAGGFRKVLVFPGVLDLPREISLYMIMEVDEPIDRIEKFLGMIVSAPKASNLTPDILLSIRITIKSILKSYIAKTLKVLVLHQVVVDLDLLELVRSLNLRTLYLHYIFIEKCIHNQYSISLPETLEAFHLILEQVIIDDLTLTLPKELKMLTVVFGPTETPYQYPMKFNGKNATSLTSL